MLEEQTMTPFRRWLKGYGEGPGQPWIPGVLDKHGMSVEQLAGKIGVTRSIIYYYLTGERSPTKETLAKICDVLQVSYEDALKYITPVDSIGRPRLSHNQATTRRRRRRSVLL